MAHYNCPGQQGGSLGTTGEHVVPGCTYGRTSTAEDCWPRVHRLELSGTTSWDVEEEIQTGTSLLLGRS
eukprot:9105721-Heterocapsa_arctica.AAC.1